MEIRLAMKWSKKVLCKNQLAKMEMHKCIYKLYGVATRNGTDRDLPFYVSVERSGKIVDYIYFDEQSGVAYSNNKTLQHNGLVLSALENMVGMFTTYEEPYKEI